MDASESQLPLVKNILTEWNLEELIPNFNENSVDFGAFTKLTEDHIKELVPKIGIRIRFLENYKNLLATPTNPIKIDRSTPIVIAGPSSEEASPSFDISAISKSSSSSVTDCEKFTGLWHDAIVGLNDAQIVNTPTYQYKVECAKNTGLEDLLNSSTKGKLIIYSYNKNHKLTSDDRNKLVELIIETELENDLHKTITCLRFEELAHAIVGIFPKECKEVYFMKTTNFKNGKVTHLGRGKLFYKYYNYRKQLRLAGLINTKVKNSIDAQLSDDEDIPLDEEISNQLEWLKQYKEPFNKVQEYWQNTFKSRQTFLRENSIYQYFNNFPILGSTCGYILLNNDFEILYPEVDDSFYVHFSKFSEKVLLYAESSKDKILGKKLKEISECKSEDGKSVRILKLLPYLVTPVAVCKKWKPSRTEISEGFLIHIKNFQDLNETIKAHEVKLKKLKLTLQPTPIVVGEDLDNIVSSYVRVDTVLYQVESPLKAIEVTFKAIHSLHALYPVEADQVWLLIQKCVFKFTTKFDKQYTSVTTLVPQLKP